MQEMQCSNKLLKQQRRDSLVLSGLCDTYENGVRLMTTEETQALALKTLHEAIQALKDCGLMIEEDEDE